MAKTPDFPLPEMIDGGPDEYDSVAMSYLFAAEILWERERDKKLALVAPATQLICTGLELFLKARLLEHGFMHKKLKEPKEFGHNIYQMWMMTQFDVMRVHAQVIAEACEKVNKSPVPDPTVQTIDWTIYHLEKLYGGETFFALRYPNGQTKVPYVQPLLWVLAKLIENPKWRS